MIVLENFNVYLAMVLNAFFTGIGTGLGIYIANSHIIKKIKKLKKRFKK